jgi:hypothetical protein
LLCSGRSQLIVDLLLLICPRLLEYSTIFEL